VLAVPEITIAAPAIGGRRRAVVLRAPLVEKPPIAALAIVKDIVLCFAIAGSMDRQNI
jgi:hypothetical protein